MSELLLSTRNPHKLREFERLLHPVRVLPLPPEVVLPPEDGATFEENARVKAAAAAQATGLVAIADDSGIEAEALGGAPGVYSARYAGPHASDQENLDKLLAEAPAGSPLAYVCVIAYAVPGRDLERTVEGAATGRLLAGVERTFEGRCTGRLAAEPRGTGGFGYDPAFLPDDGDGTRTMAELSDAEKDAISHRGRAARALLEWLATAG